MKELSWLELFVLQEPFIDTIKFQSPLFDLIVDAPVSKWENIDFNAVKELLESSMDESEYNILKKSLAVLSAPEYKYELVLDIENKRHLSFFFRKAADCVSFTASDSSTFQVGDLAPYKDSLQKYLELLEISKFQPDSTSSVHQFSFDDYLILNIAFYLEEMSRKVGADTAGNFMHFTIDDISEQFNEGDVKRITAISSLYKDDEGSKKTIDIEKVAHNLIDNGYLAHTDNNLLTLGSKSLFLFENMFRENTLKLSFTTTKYLGDEGDEHINFGTFVCTKSSVFYLHIENRKIVIDIVQSKKQLNSLFYDSFDF
ncbi:MAG TPA: hypothetical protein ENK75_04735 [Saprospiraceae bacterium]|nr:hypothetical protein [Saprospiraceae bacterium]